MGGDDPKCMTLGEFVYLLNALQAAAPSPEPIKPRVFVVKVFAAGAVKELVIRVAPEFTRATGIRAGDTAARFVDFLRTNVGGEALTEAGFSGEGFPPKSP